MAATRIMRIPGRWRQGFVLDYHIATSVYLGDDEYGHPTFDNKRTDLGELLFRLKYRADLSAVEELVRTLIEFLNSWKPIIDLIVPVPPSKPDRAVQPVLLLAEELSRRLDVPLAKDCVTKTKNTPEIKNVHNYEERLAILSKAYVVTPSVIANRRTLLFDDLYRSGATMNAMASALYDQGHVTDVFALAVTRTRSAS